MKKTFAILAAMAGASIASVAVYAGIRNKNKDKQQFEPVEEGLEPIGDLIEPIVDIVESVDEAAEKEAQEEPQQEPKEMDEPEAEEEPRRIIMRSAIVLRLPEAERTIELSPEGELRCYEDNKVVRKLNFKNWPKGKFEVNCYFGRSGYTWLFFKKLGDDAIRSYFSQMPSEYYSADHVVVVDEDLTPFSISYSKDVHVNEAKSTLGFHSGDFEKFHGGKEVLVVYDGAEHELRRLVYKGEEDNRLYVCEVSRSEASMRTQEFELDEYELMGWRIVGRVDKFYMVRDLGIPGDSTGTPCYYEDKFGKVDFKRFKSVCSAGLAKPGADIFSSFYKTVTPATIKEHFRKQAEEQ
jgi:hypothetical protein